MNRYFGNILTFLVGALMLCSAGHAFGQFVEEPYKLSISWQHTHDDDMPSLSTLNSEWGGVCNELGKEFLAPSYGWGSGVFNKFVCLSSSESAIKDKNTLNVVVTDSIKEFKVSIDGIGENSGINSEIVLPGSDKSMLILRNRDLIAKVVSFLVDGIPMAIRITEKNYDPKTKAIEFSFPTAAQNPEKIDFPKTIVLYKLGWDKRFRLWRARKLTEAQDLKVKVETQKAVLHQKEKALSIVQLSWSVVNTEKISLSAGTVWAHHVKGPGKRQKKLKKAIGKLLLEIGSDSVYDYIKDKGILASLLTAPFDSAYIGFRFGLPLLTGANYSQQTRFIGILAEIRSGWFDGFRFNADLWPKVKEVVTENGDVGEFEGSRYIISWSFRLDLPKFIDSIDIAPSIGQWSFKIDLPLDGSIAPFEARNALSFGIGVGLEWMNPNYILRLWYSQDFAVSFAKKVAGESNVTTLRVGVDLMHKIFGFKIGTKEFTMAGLGFIGYDDITLNKSGVSADDDPSIGIVDSINYVQAYSGGGLSLSW